MSDSEHAPVGKSQTAATKSNGAAEPKASAPGTKLVYVLDHHRVSAEVVEVTLNLRKHTVTVGTTGVLLGLPGARVEVTRVFYGGAKARITVAGIDKEIQHHRQVILEAGIGVTEANQSNGHFPHGSNPRAHLLPSGKTK